MSDCLHFPSTTLNTHTNLHTLVHSHLLTLIVALYLTAECLMTLGGGIGESSRYNMLDQIQAFSVPQACWKTTCIIIHSRCVWSLKLQQKNHLAHSSLHAEEFLSICALCLWLLFDVSVLFCFSFSCKHSISTHQCLTFAVTAGCLFTLLTFILLALLSLINTSRARKQKWYLLYSYCWLYTSSTLTWKDLACV